MTLDLEAPVVGGLHVIADSAAKLPYARVVKESSAARDAVARSRPAVRAHDVGPVHRESPWEQHGRTSTVDVPVQTVTARAPIVAELVCTVVPAAGKRTPVCIVAEHIAAAIGREVEETCRSRLNRTLAEEISLGRAVEQHDSGPESCRSDTQE